MKIFNTEEKSKKFRALYETYRQDMYWIGYRVLHDSHEAEDVVQSSFLKLSKVLDEIGEVDEERTKILISVVARNTAIDYYRKRKQQSAEAVEELERKEAGRNLSERNQTEAKVIEEYEYRNLLQCIEKLPAKYRDVLRLRYLCELSVSAIARQLSISEANVYARISRGKHMLQKAIQGIEEKE